MTLADIEREVLHRISLLRVGTAAAAKGLDGVTAKKVDRVVEHVRDLPKPAVLVRQDGIRRAKGGDERAVTLVVACEGLRSSGEARIGGEGVVGMQSLLDLLRQTLDGAELPCAARLVFDSESPLADDDRLLVFAQTYAVEELG